jgi:putative endonuclease
MGSEPYFYQWQNPHLLKTIYPFREMKFKDFLMIYQEVDLWANLKSRNVNDPDVSSRLAELEEKSKLEREKVVQELQISLQARLQADPWFAKITGANDKSLRFKRVYYLDRMTTDYLQRLADLESRQKSYLRRMEWYPQNDERRITWENRVRELDTPISVVRQELEGLVNLRNLFDREARLPQPGAKKQATVADLARAELDEYRKELDQLSSDEILKRVWERLNETRPDGKPRFEKWFKYMVIHFSGMRYMSAHGSWADPDDLLELLVREELEGKLAPGEDIDDKIEAEIIRLMNIPADESTRHLNPALKALVFFKQQKDRQGDPIPDWVWDEIVKYTQLRLEVTSDIWEASSPERWKYENRRWRDIMTNWQRDDITIWRKEHRETLDLIVTRAVCNEIAEHIQHLRGITPAAGLTAKPSWYLRLEGKTKNLPEGDPLRCFFHNASDPKDFINGASIFWLGWVEREPNAWQIARPLAGIELWPGIKSTGGQAGKPKVKESPKGKQPAPEGWIYQQTSSAFIRSRSISIQIPTVQELRKKGMTDREIDQYRKELRSQNTSEKQYLRWKHEAIVVGVVELIDGKHVLTFETGKIGLNWHHIDNLINNPIDRIFLGYIPPAGQEPENLALMLDPQKILKTYPQVVEIPRPREGFSLAGEPEEEVQVVEVQVPQQLPPAEKFYVYAITNRQRKSLFIGVTREIKIRFFEHVHHLLPGFSKKRKLNRLVYYQAYNTLGDALAVLEKLEKLSLQEKKEFISANNPRWRDLSDELSLA